MVGSIIAEKTTVHPSREREHALLVSRSGRRACVLEVHACPGQDPEAFEVSGWLSPGRARERLAALEGRWLAPSSQERMRAGAVLHPAELEWTG